MDASTSIRLNGVRTPEARSSARVQMPAGSPLTPAYTRSRRSSTANVPVPGSPPVTARGSSVSPVRR